MAIIIPQKIPKSRFSVETNLLTTQISAIVAER
jgi:hypothetical protein